jgi:hypothetical protein
MNACGEEGGFGPARLLRRQLSLYSILSETNA